MNYFAIIIALVIIAILVFRKYYKIHDDSVKGDSYRFIGWGALISAGLGIIVFFVAIFLAMCASRGGCFN